jgi:hypothetical protein
MRVVSTATAEAPPTPEAALPARPRPPASIVPLAGLPVVGIVLTLLVVSIAGNWQWALDFFHVVGGGMWTSLDLFVGFVVGPYVIANMSLPARAEFTGRFMSAMALIMPTLVTMTLASGFQLARHLGYLDGSSPRHAWIVASFFLVGVMAVVAIGVIEPAILAVLFELRKPQPDGALIGRLMRRFVYTSGITGLMQVGTLIIMPRIAS